MVRSRRAKNVSRKGPVPRARASRRQKTLAARRMGYSMDLKAVQYRSLLLDPCNGPLVPPTAVGPTSGLIFRQKKIISLDFTAGTTHSTFNTRSFFAVYRPATGVVITGMGLDSNAIAGTGNVTTVDLEDSLLTNARSYRAVAGCIKFVPTGAIGSRSGVVASAYVPDNIQVPPNGSNTGTGINTLVSSYMGFTQHTMSNASSPELPEVRWIPSDPADLEFRQKDVTYNADTGSCLLIGRNIDGPGASATAAMSINGYLEVTTIFEWIPEYSQGIVSSVQAGSTTSLQVVLASMGDLARAATDHVYAAGLLRQFGYGAAGAAMNYMAGITGLAINQRPGPSLLTSGRTEF